ncbi:hypothetical protein AAFF_G00169240 [Aldrovandia affinis]|uniref:Uncharacterized protein n=1 Tax=Aldrovandia affinis TaxID=143900 RepID=A0AAD7RLM4_9TELE|nr:hypothetical protein AAFF_G00169240 [Aldrovandia affinis]
MPLTPGSINYSPTGYAQQQHVAATPTLVWTCPMHPQGCHTIPSEQETQPSSIPLLATGKVQRKRRRLRNPDTFSEKYRRLMVVMGRGEVGARAGASAGPEGRARWSERQCMCGHCQLNPPHPDSFAVMYRTWMENVEDRIKKEDMTAFERIGSPTPVSQMDQHENNEPDLILVVPEDTKPCICVMSGRDPALPPGQAAASPN